MMSSKRPVNVPYILKSQPSKQQHTAGIQLWEHHHIQTKT
jgi:hypothetical protein